MRDVPTRADARLSPVIRLAPAKVNLTLAVTGRRPDGYHELHSVMVPLALADRLSLAPSAGPEDSITVTGFDTGPARDNLVLRAISATRAALGRRVDAHPIAIRLEKRVPVAAGLAGGSSDAASAIDAALEVWGLRTDAESPDPDLEALRAVVAARVGSDVPFFLAGGPALVTGRGETVDPLPTLRGPAPGMLLVTPAVHLSTTGVFAALDGGPGAGPIDPRSTRVSSEHLAGEWRAGMGTTALVARAGILASANDLAAAADAMLPGLRALRRALARCLSRPVGLSGSGPTLWVIYASAGEAVAAADAVGAGLRDGSIVAPGRDRPSIVATTIAAGGEPLGSRPED